jgi:hypothetical protein
MARALEIEIIDRARMVLHEAPSPSQLTREQEKELVSDPKLLHAVHALENADSVCYGEP